MAEVESAPSPASARRPFKVALMAALPLEVRPFLRLLKARRRKDLGFPAWEFPVGEGRGILALSGMGSEAANLAAERVLALFRPQTLFSVGFGGSLAPELVPGTIVLGQSFWHFNPGEGFLVTVPPPAPPWPLTELLRQLNLAGLPACTGSIVTTSYIIHKGRQGGQIRRLRRPVLDLETSVLAEMAAARGLAFMSMRVITDGAAEEIPDFLIKGLKLGPTKESPAALSWLLADPRAVVPLVKLWRRSREAAARLARALTVILPLAGD